MSKLSYVCASVCVFGSMRASVCVRVVAHARTKARAAFRVSLTRACVLVHASTYGRVRWCVRARLIYFLFV